MADGTHPTGTVPQRLLWHQLHTGDLQTKNTEKWIRVRVIAYYI
jgi:hypothetical protein